MSDLRIIDAPEIPTEEITGSEKLPTGGNGNYSISLDSIANHTKTSLDLASQTDVQTSSNGVKAQLDQHKTDLNNPHQVTKGQIGLGNVDNTADADKPMSNAVQSAITTLTNNKADKTSVYLKTETYNKTEVDSYLATKPNSTTVYTKTEVNTLLNDKVTSVNGKTGTAITLTRSDLGISSDIVMQQWEKEAKYVVDEIGLNQQKINNGLESIVELISINNPKNGNRQYVKSYYVDGQVGGGDFVYLTVNSGVNNGVNIFNGWTRLNWNDPTIDDAGILEATSDSSAKLQSLVDASVNMKIDLKGKTVKFTALDLPSNTYFFNGTLDGSASTWGDTSGRGAIMFKTTPRSASGVDYEDQSVYASLAETKNITFDNVHFKGKSDFGMLFKFSGLKFLNCSGEWITGHLFKLVGGWKGTPLVNDTPTSYNLVDPINGRNKDILIDNCHWKGGYTNGKFASPFRFVACEDVVINNGVNDSPLGWLIDSYNKNIRLNSASYINSNMQIVTDIINGTAEPDMLAVYIGQNTYDVHISGGEWVNFGRKGLYAEVASQIYIDNVASKCTNLSNIASFIEIQGNYKDASNTYTGNCADIYINNVSSTGTKEGINITPLNGVQGIKNFNVSNANVTINSNVESLVLRGVADSLISEYHTNGSLYIGANLSNVNIKSSSFTKQSNYALYVADMGTSSNVNISDVDFKVTTGVAIYNNGGGSNTLLLDGGSIVTLDGSARMQLGSTPCALTAYNFNYGGAKFLPVFRELTLTSGAKTSFYISNTLYKDGWIHNMVFTGGDMQGIDLDIRASVGNGSVFATVENKGSPFTAKTISFNLSFNTYLDNQYLN